MTAGTVIQSFASPAAQPRGVEWDGRFLWITSQSTDLIYQVNPVTGSVIKSFAAPDSTPTELAFDGHFLWLCGGETNTIFQLDQITETTIKSFSAPSTLSSGLMWVPCLIFETLNRPSLVNPSS